MVWVVGGFVSGVLGALLYLGGKVWFTKRAVEAYDEHIRQRGYRLLKVAHPHEQVVMDAGELACLLAVARAAQRLQATNTHQGYQARLHELQAALAAWEQRR